VHHALTVRVVQRPRDLLGDAQRLLDRHPLLAVEEGAQRVAADVRHDVVQERVRLAGVDERDDVRMREPGGHLDLAAEPLRPEHAGQLGLQDLDREIAVVLRIIGQVHGGHAAAAEPRGDAVSIAERRLQARELANVIHGHYRAA
jgi:hypothetical protein